MPEGKTWKNRKNSKWLVLKWNLSEEEAGRAKYSTEGHIKYLEFDSLPRNECDVVKWWKPEDIFQVPLVLLWYYLETCSLMGNEWVEKRIECEDSLLEIRLLPKRLPFDGMQRLTPEWFFIFLFSSLMNEKVTCKVIILPATQSGIYKTSFFPRC